MLFGAATVRLPREGEAPRVVSARTPPGPSLTAREAIAQRDFWLVWLVLFANVTAGIGLLAQASPMVQDLFAGRVGADAASGFLGLLSLFNLGGRLGWSSASDRLGRKSTYAIYLGLSGWRSIWRFPSSRGWGASAASSSWRRCCCRCTGAASRRCRPTSATSSAPARWARSTGAS
jgi:hypothetical protein